MKFGSKLKVLSLTLCALMMISAFSLTVSAAPTLTVGTLTQSEADANGLVTVTVPFTATDVAQVTLLAVKAATSITTAPAAEEANIAYIDQQAAGTGSFTFKVDKNALETAGTTKLFIKVGGTSLDVPGQEVITIGTTLVLGDVNGKDGIDASDALCILQYLANIDTAGTNEVAPGAITDIDNQNGTDASDALRILQYLASIVSTLR